MMGKFAMVITVVLAVAFAGALLLTAALKSSKPKYLEQQRRLSLERCAEKWSPREVELTEHGMCRVKIDGQWWPEDAVKVSE